MRALLLDGEPRLVSDHPSPERKPGEARLRLRVAGVCDTDIQLSRGYMNYRGVLGHEFVGEVLEHDDSSWVGRRVVGDINAGCGECLDCRERDGHHCAKRTVLGIVGRDGAFAEELLLPQRCLVSVPDALDDDAAVFAEPLAAGLHVLDELGGASAAQVCVLGDGKLGLLTALAVAGAGHRVTVVGHHREKLSLATEAGLDTCLEDELEIEPRFALVVEATGSAAGLARALELTQPRGTVVLKTTVAAKLELDLAPLVINELKLVGSRCGDLSQAIDFMATGKLDPRALIVARYPLSQADTALEHATRRGTLKVLIDG